MLIIPFLFVATVSTAFAGDSVEVWGIARCPDTSKFIRNQLLPFYENYGPFPEDFKLDYHAVPTAITTIDGRLTAMCLHGETECALNKLQMCSKKHMESDWMIVMGCIQGKRSYESAVECLPEDEEGEKIKACAESEEGDLVLNDENSYRYNMAPHSAWLPWVQINGERVQEAEQNLQQYICQLESMKNTKACENL